MTLKELKELIANGEDDMEILLPEPKIVTETVYVNSELPTQMPIQEQYTTVKHSCNLGDVIAAMIACKKYYDVTKRKIVFAQTINMAANYYAGATHPTTHDGVQVCINQPMFEMVRPLLESQEYIAKMEPYSGQSIHLDFDAIRGKTFVNMPHGSIQAWLFYAFPDLDCDISKPWIFLDEQKQQIEEVTKGKVIVNFTERYRNGIIDYFFLKNYAPDLIFAGTEREHFLFCTKNQLSDVPRLEIKDFLELAYAIRGCRFLISNQSMCWNLSTALGTPRMLEVCQFAQNCMPFYGENNVGYFHQVGAEYYFRRMYNETK